MQRATNIRGARTKKKRETDKETEKIDTVNLEPFLPGAGQRSTRPPPRCERLPEEHHVLTQVRPFLDRVLQKRVEHSRTVPDHVFFRDPSRLGHRVSEIRPSASCVCGVTGNENVNDRDSPLPLGQPHVHVALDLFPTNQFLDEKELRACGHLRLGAVRTCTRIGYIPKRLASRAFTKKSRVEHAIRHENGALCDSLVVLKNGSFVQRSRSKK